MILQKCGIILEQLQVHGLTINTTKSVIILALAGTSHRDVRARLVTHTADGQMIKIKGAGNQTFHVPLAKKTKYLGCIISYDRMESDTLKHRLSLMKIAFDRLRKWLTAKHGMTMLTRMQLWQTCVLPVLTYGIFVIGLAPQDLQRIQITMFTMLRQILHNHLFRTGMTHEQVLSRWNLLHPLALLWHAADSLHRSVTQNQHLLSANDIARNIDWSSLVAVKDMIWNHHLIGLEASGLPGPDTFLQSGTQEEDIITCEICGFLCQHVSVLRRHYTLAHKITPGVPWSPPLLRGRRGTMCAAKGSDVRPGVPWSPPLLRGRRGTMCTAKGSDVRPGVPWSPPLLRGRLGTMCIAKGSGSLTHSFTHSLIHSFTHSLIHSFTHSLIHSHSLTLTLTLTHTHTHSHSHSLSPSLTLTLTLTHSHS